MYKSSFIKNLLFVVALFKTMSVCSQTSELTYPNFNYL